MAVADFLRNPFSFLFAKSSQEERIAAYIVREHDRGRSLEEILNDPYVRNRATPSQLARVLERPEVIRALGEDVAESARQTIAN
ncbi:MAG: hypothetical protein M3R70_03945 [Actinomycetota bacterium]|nr:hypothetical protein [Actinomycetota bacterium]